jgi:hypothetical protein
MKSNINNNDYKITIEMLNQMNELRVTEAKIEDILNYEKGSRVAGEVLYYLSKDWINSNYKYEQDHLHPASRFDENKPPSISIEDWKNWRNNRNKIANLQLLEGRSNGSKNDMSLSEYYYQMNSEQQNIFLKQSLISPTVSLDFSDFDMFYQERLCTMTDKIRQLLNGKF